MGMFISYPLVNEPECYVDPDFDEGSEALDLGKQLHEINLTYCRDMIEHRIRRIKEQAKFQKYGYVWPDFVQELKKRYPDWTKDDLLNLKHQFEFFDTSGDKLLCFKDFSAALDLMNYSGSEADRRALFNRADVWKYNTINFDEYLQLMYSIKQGMPILRPPEEVKDHERGMEEIIHQVSHMDPFRKMCYGVF